MHICLRRMFYIILYNSKVFSLYKSVWCSKWLAHHFYNSITCIYSKIMLSCKAQFLLLIRVVLNYHNWEILAIFFVLSKVNLSEWILQNRFNFMVNCAFCAESVNKCRFFIILNHKDAFCLSLVQQFARKKENSVCLTTWAFMSQSLASAVVFPFLETVTQLTEQQT